MGHFDTDFAEDAITRIHSIPKDAQPQWGSMTRDKMINHLAKTLKYVMGRYGRLQHQDTWLSRNLIGPLLINGILPFPKNVKVKGIKDETDQMDDLESLHAIIEDYLHIAHTGELEALPHPFFGDIGVDGWDKLHIKHFNHHIRQFKA